MIGLGRVIYYNKDGMDWLRTIVRSVYTYTGPYDAVHVVSMAAKRACRLYHKKTDITVILGREYHG